jgi:putative transposase
LQVRLVSKFRYQKNEQLNVLTHISKSLYNEANYIIKQELDKNHTWVRYSELDKTLKNSSPNYKLLKAQTSQQILKLLDKNWKSFFKAIKDWKKHPEKYKEKPNPPYFKRKDGHYLIIFTNQNSKLENNKIILTMSKTFEEKYPDLSNTLEIPIPNYKDKSFDTFQQIRILPRRKFLEIEIVYLQEIINSDLDYNAYFSMDLGVGNLITGVENKNTNPIIISGTILKSVNQDWNKRRAKLMSVKDKQKLKWTAKLDSITTNRNAFVNDYLHKTACFVINHCLEQKIGNICFGELKHIKDNVQLGKRTNQNFVSIPIQKLKQMIVYKAELVGINIIEVDEAYTSKCSALDVEPIKKHKKYVGRRVSRGLFKGSNYLLNADVNGSLNILRKVIGDGFIRNLSDRGCWFQPIRIRDIVQTSYEQFLIKSVITL